MMMEQTCIPLYDVLEQSNQISEINNIGEVINQYIKLLINVSKGTGCALFINNYDSTNCLVKIDVQSNSYNIENIFLSIANETILDGKIIDLKKAEDFEKYGFTKKDLSGSSRIENIISVPISTGDKITGAIIIVNGSNIDISLVRFIGNRIAIDIDIKQNLYKENLRNERLECLVDIFGRISSTLDRDQILNLIIEYVYKILGAEAGSLFFLDEKTGESILYISSNLNSLIKSEVRVPSGRGIIGTVIKTGKTIIVNDVKLDKRHYRKVDEQTGKDTRSILAVPLIARTVVLGGLRGSTEERIIGGIEAINKINGEFTEDDAELLRTLANQAATVLEIAQLYLDANDLFLSSIKALTAAIDAKDSYTEGHSQRVSEISVEIARELGLTDKEIYKVQIGSLMHDVGKIGISDNILKKPGKLTQEEYAEMKQHPLIGEKIMSQLHLLSSEILAVAEHHERPDGSGYPRGLKGKEISIYGRIVAVADVFDAMTSDRPYRDSLTVDEVFDHLWNGIDTQFDKKCVEALECIYRRGTLSIQKDSVQQDIFGITLDTSK